MKTKILFIVLFVQIMLSVPTYAQNYRHSLPIRTENVVIIREWDDMYEEKTVTIGSHSEVTNTTYIETKIERKFLYTIPVHLKSLDREDIDQIMKGKIIQKITWSWFIIWDTTYTKTKVFKKTSILAIKVAIYSFFSFLIFVSILGFMFTRKGDLITVLEINYYWILFSAVIGFLTYPVGVFFMNYEKDFVFPFIFVPYSILIGYICHVSMMCYRRFYPE